MNKNKAITTLVYIILIFIVLVVLAIFAYNWPDNDNLQPIADNDSNETTIINEKFIQLELPAKWKMLKETYVNVGEGYADEAYILQKDNYYIYINPRTGLTSGTEVGRFAEVAQRIPSASLVINTQPSPPCEDSIISEIDDLLIRGDLYVSNDNTSAWCNKPKIGSIWYGSYISTLDSGYFGELKKLNLSETDLRFLITFGYEGVTDINDLPNQNSQKLNRMLREMEDIVKSIEFK